VRAILEASARVFAEEGFAAGTTNRIARKAGVSIGSLYEYFPNKGSILVALIEKHMADGLAQLDALLAETPRGSEDLDAVLRRFVTALLAFHARNPELHRVLFEEAPHPPELHACLLQMEEKLAHALESRLRGSVELAVRDSDVAAHLVVQVVEALTHRFVLHGIHELPDDVFVDEVVHLVRAYLGGRDRPARVGAGDAAR
jgi:AcrR family transcriptional regulator